MQLSVPGRSKKLKWSFFILVVLTFAFTLFMKHYLHPLESPEIVQFEMAKTSDKASTIIQQWQAGGKVDAVITSVYLDYIFILLYTVTISLGCLYISSISGNILLSQTGWLFAILIFLAGIFDIVENRAMLDTLRQGITADGVSLTYKMAISKFSIILMSLFFIAICLVSWVAGLLTRKKALTDMKREMTIMRNLTQRNS